VIERRGMASPCWQFRSAGTPHQQGVRTEARLWSSSTKLSTAIWCAPCGATPSPLSERPTDHRRRRRLTGSAPTAGGQTHGAAGGGVHHQVPVHVVG